MPDNIVSPEGGSYPDYRQEHRYETDPGVVISASANRTGAARLLRVHGGVGKRIVDFRATRAGAPPLIPSATDTTHDTLVGHALTVPLPVFNQVLGRYNFTAEGRYTYLQNAPRVPGTDVFPTGRYPYPLAGADEVAASLFATIPGVAVAWAGANVIVDTVNAVIGATDITKPYTWYLTALPAETFTTLITG